MEARPRNVKGMVRLARCKTADLQQSGPQNFLVSPKTAMTATTKANMVDCQQTQNCTIGTRTSAYRRRTGPSRETKKGGHRYRRKKRGGKHTKLE